MTQLQTATKRIQRPKLSIVDSRPVTHAAVTGNPKAVEQWNAVLPLIEAAGGKLLTTADATSTSTGAPIAPQHWLNTHSPLGSKDAFCTYRIRGLRGVLAAENSSLAITLVGIDLSAGTAEVRNVLGKVDLNLANTEIGIHEDLNNAARLASTRSTQGLYNARVWNAEVTSHPGCQLLLAPLNRIDALAHLFAKVSGTESLLTKRSSSTSGTIISCNAKAAANQAEPDPSPVVLTAVEWLHALGQVTAAKRLHNAWLATLEAGFHTSALKHIAPYTQCIAASTFLDKIGQHMGKAPSRLGAQLQRRSQPGLKLVG